MDSRSVQDFSVSELRQTAFCPSHIYPVFQPIFDASMEVFSFEALMRVHQSSAFSRIDLYVNELEQTGQIALADIAMVHLVQAHIHLLRSKSVAVNVSLHTLETNFDEYLHVVRDLSRSSKQLIVELTETAPIVDFSFLEQCARDLRSAGVLIAFDDACDTHPYGHPDFIQTIQPDILKVDGQFFHAALEDECRLESLRAMVDATHTSGGKVVVEWVDTLERYKEALLVGADFTQGFLFGPPEHCQDPKPRSASTLLWETFTMRSEEDRLKCI